MAASKQPKKPLPARTQPSHPDALANDAEAIRKAVLQHLEFSLGELHRHVDSHWEPYVALALAVRDRLIEGWVRTQDAYYDQDAKRVYYMSLEFLMGRTLGNALTNLDIVKTTADAVDKLGYQLEDLRDAEWDSGLGNGGLGRLAACFLDSLATLQLPAYGYGIRYEYGIFHQRIVDGAQVESPDKWLALGNPWEISRPNDAVKVQFGGGVEHVQEGNRLKAVWKDTDDILAVPNDTPIPGYKNGTVNTLRLWSARATHEFNFKDFNAGDYVGAVESKVRSESISKVLYPNDASASGKELRLRQEYFFVSATLQDVIRRHKKQYMMHDQKRGLAPLQRFAEKNAIQLNDTHPALAIPEFMRLLLDQEELGWDDAWKLTVETFGYTNHTVMPEALERWSVELMSRLLPRHLEIIYEINRRFLDQLRARFPDADATGMSRRMSIIEEGPQRMVRMAYLAIVGSHSINGVAALHTDILKADLFRDFFRMWPERFNNKTNGITQRRWLLKSNPTLSSLITSAIGDSWITNLDHLKKLIPLASDAAFGEKWRKVKLLNKQRLAGIIQEQYQKRDQQLVVSPEAMFDCQVKRIHEYKRQLLNVLHVITLYNRIKDNPRGDFTPRVVIFAGKSAPGYAMAKLAIRLINGVASVVNADKDVGGRLKVVFLADYRVSLAERIFPAADLSEQISTAGTEASGTGNMKFGLNGALTIGTLDGANIEMSEEVGQEDMFIFGLKAEEVRALKPHYNPMQYAEANKDLWRVVQMISNGTFSPDEPDLFRPIVESWLRRDEYLLMADYAAYITAQDRVSKAYRNPAEWTRKSILNVAKMGRFSTDRTIGEYARDVWQVKPVNPHA
jgi:starch phosphorylase